MPRTKAIRGQGGEIVLYGSKDGRTTLDVRLDRETVWLTLQQMADLFGRERSVIAKHVGNVYREGELAAAATRADFAQVRREGGRTVTREVDHYNLDVIISVGYRVKSPQGTQFRIWATQVLREHILRGYTLNERRLQAQVARLAELQAAVDVMGRVLTTKALSGAEAEGLLRVISDYSLALRLLDQYDHGQLRLEATTQTARFVLTYEAASEAIARMAASMGAAAGGLFGREKDKGLASALAAVYQTFGGQDLYPSLEEKAAHLLYFVVKNHAFLDGNKRIGALLFLWFLDGNGLLFRADGTKRLADNALVALTLLIAESKPAEKDTIAAVIVNLINRENV